MLADHFNLDHAEGRAWAKRTDAFGTVAKPGGLLNRTGSEDYQCIYRERRLQPFWRLHSRSVAAYERTRRSAVPVARDIRSVAAEMKAVEGQEFHLAGLEFCREETDHETLFDGLTREQNPALATYLAFHASPANTETLTVAAQAGTVVVPPEVKASTVVREVVSSAIGRIEADRILEELVIVDAVDLFYRPVYAFRYWARRR